MHPFFTCLLTAGLTVSSLGAPALTDGSVLGFWGDSITHAEYSGINYTHVLYNYYVTHMPDTKLELRNLGVGGARLTHALDLYQVDPAARGLTDAVVEYGINDLQKYLYEDPDLYPEGSDARVENLVDYQANLEAFLHTLEQGGVLADHIAIATLPVPDGLRFGTDDEDYQAKNEARTRVEEGFARISDVIRDTAAEEQVHLLELQYPLNKLAASLSEEQKASDIMLEDLLHLNTAGQIYLAYLILEEQGALTEVSQVNIQKGSLLSSDAEVSHLHYEDDYLYYDYRANRLPMGVSHEYFEADETLHILDRMNREMIRVSDLNPDTTYDLYMDGRVLGSYTGSDFASGVNIANLRENPTQEYARAIEQLNRGRRAEELSYRKLVQNYTDCGSGAVTAEDIAAGYADWQPKDAEYREAMYTSARTCIQAVHRVAIVRQGVTPPKAALSAPGGSSRKLLFVGVAGGFAVIVLVVGIFRTVYRKRKTD